MVLGCAHQNKWRPWEILYRKGIREDGDCSIILPLFEKKLKEKVLTNFSLKKIVVHRAKKKIYSFIITQRTEKFLF